MTAIKTKKTSRLFTAAAWGAMTLSVAGLGIADIAYAAEQRPERESRFENRAQMPERRSWQQDRESQPAQVNAPPRTQPAQAPQRNTNQSQNRDRPPTMTEARQGSFWRQNRPQPDQPSQDRQDQRSGWSGQRSDQRSDWRDQRSDQRNQRSDQRDQRNDWRNQQLGQRNDRRDDRSERRDDRRDQRYDRRDDRRDWRDARRWDRSDWRRDNRYDWRAYRARNRSVYRIGTYHTPYYGYRYRRVGVGFMLRSMFYGSTYWIGDPWYYRLPEVYGPYRWVRYYDDALLVNIYTGEVVDVVYDIFW